MMKSGNQPESSTRRKRRRSTAKEAPEAVADISQQLQSIELRIGELVGSHPAAVPADHDGTATQVAEQLADIQRTLLSQSDSMRDLANGFKEFRKQIASDIIQALQDAGLTTIQSPDGVPEEADDEKTPAKELLQPADSEPVAASENSSWAMIRQAMLDSTSEEVPIEQSDELVAAENETTPATGPPEETDEPMELTEPLGFAVPAPFNAELIADESLRAEFLAREEIMRLMSVRLRQRVQPLPVISTEQLREIAETLPDDLRQRTEQSLGQLDEQLRLTELELSLERARIAREVTRVESTRETVESTARQMGYQIRADGTLEVTPDSIAAGNPGRRWLRVLGFGR